MNSRYTSLLVIILFCLPLVSSAKQAEYRNDRNNNVHSSTVGSTTSTYSYDQDDRRLKKTSGTQTTNYPFPFYEVTNTGTTTKHIYAGDVLLSSVESGAPGGGSSDSGLKTTGTVETNTG